MLHDIFVIAETAQDAARRARQAIPGLTFERTYGIADGIEPFAAYAAWRDAHPFRKVHWAEGDWDGVQPVHTYRVSGETR